MKQLLTFILIISYLLIGCHNGDTDYLHSEHEVDRHNEATVENYREGDDKDEHGNDEHEEEEGAEHDHNAEYAMMEIKKQNFYEIIHTSGQILPAQGDEITITSMHNGLVIFNRNTLLPGKEVANGQLLLTISGKELIHDNIESGYLEAKTAFENALKDFERAVELNKEKIISDKEFLDIKLSYEKSRNNYDIIKKNYATGGQKVIASMTGYIKDILVEEGQYVETGQSLLHLTRNKRLVLRADVPQQYFTKMKDISSANFITIYDDRLYDVDKLNGKLISYGKTTSENSLFAPIYFEVDNLGNLLSGSYVEVFLKTTTMPGCIIIPKSAILEESGRYYVYVEEGEEFEKRYIELDGTDGENYRVLSGLSEGEHMVSENAYQVKLASLSNAIPQHSHAH